MRQATKITAAAIVKGTGNELLPVLDIDCVIISKQFVPFVLYPTGQLDKHAPFSKLYPDTQL